MPGYGVNGHRHRIYLKDFDGSDEWVEIKASRSSGSNARVQFAGATITGISASGAPIVAVKAQPLLEMRAALFDESIVAWSLKADENDADPMPLSTTTFTEVLDGQVGDWLDAQITNYYNRRRLSTDQVEESSGR